jgi:hypothetical protein
MTGEKKMIDLADLDTVSKANEGFDVPLFHPGTKEDLGITIRILGRDSERFQEVSRRQQRRRTAKLSKGGFRPGKAGSSLTPEELEAGTIELLAECTVGWSPITIKGEDVPFSLENAKMLYKDYPWIREQVDDAMDDRANFI